MRQDTGTYMVVRFQHLSCEISTLDYENLGIYVVTLEHPTKYFFSKDRAKMLIEK